MTIYRPWIRFIDSDSSDISAIFGDGNDGDVEVSTEITLTRDMYYNNLTITGTGTINTASYRIFVKGILTVHEFGTIQNNGLNGSTGSGGGTPPSGVFGPGGYGAEGGYFLGLPDGEPGGSTVTGGGSGGAGGDGTDGVGGIPGLIALNNNEGGIRYFGHYPQIVKGSTVGGAIRYAGGTGGGGGGGGNSVEMGGGGGSGAGVVLICAADIMAYNYSNIKAVGGNGGDGESMTDTGGGGGGGGGSILVISNALRRNIQWVVDVSGGVGGAGYRTGTSGGAGLYYLLCSEE